MNSVTAAKTAASLAQRDRNGCPCNTSCCSDEYCAIATVVSASPSGGQSVQTDVVPSISAPYVATITKSVGHSTKGTSSRNIVSLHRVMVWLVSCLGAG